MNKFKAADDSVDQQRGIDHIGVGIGAIVHDGKGNILLMKRGPKARDEQGRWDICGGAVEFGESIDEAILRELNEELCTKPIDIEFLSAYDVHREFSGTHTHWIQLIHSVKVKPNTVKIGEPHKISEIGWFTIDSLPSPQHSQLHRAMALAEKAGIFN